jgi:hypothetical protein
MAEEAEGESSSGGFGRSDSSSVARQPLVIDALNKLDYFIPVDDEDFAGASPWELVAAMETRVRRFIQACEASGFHPHFVVGLGCTVFFFFFILRSSVKLRASTR